MSMMIHMDMDVWCNHQDLNDEIWQIVIIIVMLITMYTIELLSLTILNNGYLYLFMANGWMWFIGEIWASGLEKAWSQGSLRDLRKVGDI
jgi:hypothetical protein